MILAEAWRRLGIAATADNKAIRSAYASRLKALDVDANRDMFALLREARDQALAWAAAQQSEAEAPPATDAAAPAAAPPATSMADLRAPLLTEPTACAAIVARSPDLPDAFVGPMLAAGFAMPPAAGAALTMSLPRWQVPFVHPFPAAEGRVGIGPGRPRDDQALHALLFPPEDQSGDRPLTEAEASQARVYIDALHRQANDGEIGFHANVESWLSETLARAWPRSQPLLAHAAALFDWKAQIGQIGVAPAIAYINQRIATDRFHTAVQQRGHPLNTAWRQLTRPTREGQTRAFWRQRKRVAELLGLVRRDHPDLEARFDPRRVALWDGRPQTSKRVSFRLWGFAIFLLIQLVSAVSRYHASSPPTLPALQMPGGEVTPETLDRNPRPSPGSLTERDADVAQAIRVALGPDVTRERLHADAPLVEMLFQVNWTIQLELGKGLADYTGEMARIIRDRYVQLVHQAGGDELLRYQRLRLAEARSLKGRHWDACAKVARTGLLADPALIPAGQIAEERKRIAKLVLGTPGNPERRRGAPTFRIPAAIVRQTLAGSGLSVEEVKAAFQQKAGDKAMCLTHIALLQAVLDSDAETRAGLIQDI